MSSTERRHKLIIADDHPLVLRGVEDLVSAEPDLAIVAKCASGDETITALRRLQPDLAVLDVAMPGKSGLEVLRAVRAERLPTRIVLLTASIADSDVLDATAAGLDGLVMKDAAPDELVACIRTVLAGGTWLSREAVNGAVAREMVQRAQPGRHADLLTPREREIVASVAEGLSNKVIAHRLGVSEGTVKIHLHNIYGKLGVRSRTALLSRIFGGEGRRD
jgi:two-component system, NarL family, nitrate/nitrite response regulator NarL